MADTPASNDSRSTFLEDSVLVEEPAQKSGSDPESDDTKKSKHVEFAPDPRPPILRSSRYTILRGGRHRGQRGESASDAGIPSVQAVIEAYEAGKQSREGAPPTPSTENRFILARDSQIRRNSSRSTSERAEYAGSDRQPTVEEPSPSPSASSSTSSLPSRFEAQRQQQADGSGSHDRFKRTRFADDSLNDRHEVVEVIRAEHPFSRNTYKYPPATTGSDYYGDEYHDSYDRPRRERRLSPDSVRFRRRSPRASPRRYRYDSGDSLPAPSINVYNSRDRGEDGPYPPYAPYSRKSTDGDYWGDDAYADPYGRFSQRRRPSPHRFRSRTPSPPPRKTGWEDEPSYLYPGASSGLYRSRSQSHGADHMTAGENNAFVPVPRYDEAVGQRPNPFAPVSRYDEEATYRSRSRGRSRLGDRYGDSLGDQSQRSRPAPVINVYNRMDQDASPYSPYPPFASGSQSYPAYPSRSRTSPRHSPTRDRLGDELAYELADMSLEQRYRSRSRGRADSVGLSSVPIPAWGSSLEDRQRLGDRLALAATPSAPLEAEIILLEKERKQLRAKAAADAIESRLKLEERIEEAEKDDEAAANDERETSSLSTGYDFVLPKWYSSTKESDPTRQADSSAINPSVPVRAIPNTKIMHVMNSQWASAASGSGNATLEATLGHNAQFEFVWVHIHKPAHKFADLAEVASSLPSLSMTVQTQVMKFLDDIRSKYEKQKNSGLELDPNAIFCSPRIARNDVSLCFTACETFQVRNLASSMPQSFNAHPSRPLLEVLKPGANAARESKQVLSRAISGKDTKCVSVTPTWLLLVGGSCLITASARSEDELLPRGSVSKALALVPSPAPNTSYSPGSGSVRLTYAGRSWTIPASSCQSWPQLWSSVLEAFAERAHGLTIFHGGKALDSKTWKIVRKQDRNAVLDLRISTDKLHQTPLFVKALQDDVQKYVAADEPPDPPASGTKGSQDSVQNMQPPSDSKALLGIFHTSKSNDRNVRIVEIADELHKILSGNTVPIVQNAYRDCDMTAPKDIDTILRDHNIPPSWRQQSRDRVEFVVQIKHLVSFFWPQNADHEILLRFRGMLRTILNSGRPLPDHDMYYMYNWQTANELLKRSLSTAAWITATFIDDTECFSTLPADFVKAWLHLHTAVALLSLPPKRFDQRSMTPEAAIRHLELCATCLETADEALVKQLRDVDIKEHECAQANGVFWLALSRLMSEEVGTTMEIADTYRQYLSNLDPEITNNPTDRNLQERLRMFKEEVEGIRDILDRNFTAIAKARDAKAMGIVDANQVRPPLGGDDPRLKLSRDTLLRLRRKRDRFNELAELAAVLQSRTDREVVEVKNDQEKAIYLFTIVTVIFLPLSFVSSLFGMNTSDIRNLDESQWIFWVVAIPVTILVIGACLWFAGGIRLILGWSSTTHPHKSNSIVISPPPSYQDAVGETYYDAGKEKRQPDRNIDAFNADRYKSPPMPLRHTPRSGLDYYSTAGDDGDRYSHAVRRQPIRRRTTRDFY